MSKAPDKIYLSVEPDRIDRFWYHEAPDDKYLHIQDVGYIRNDADAIMAMIKPKELVWEFEPNCDYELKPCPLCGGGASISSHAFYANVECLECGCTVGYTHPSYTKNSKELSVSNVLEKWNKRAWPAPVNIRNKVTSK